MAKFVPCGHPECKEQVSVAEVVVGTNHYSPYRSDQRYFCSTACRDAFATSRAWWTP